MIFTDLQTSLFPFLVDTLKECACVGVHVLTHPDLQLHSLFYLLGWQYHTVLIFISQVYGLIVHWESHLFPILFITGGHQLTFCCFW